MHFATAIISGGVQGGLFKLTDLIKTICRSANIKELLTMAIRQPQIHQRGLERGLGMAEVHCISKEENNIFLGR